ncbi:MAG: zinc-dependent metalloprotease family protein [Bacteroidota bacterium]
MRNTLNVIRKYKFALFVLGLFAFDSCLQPSAETRHEKATPKTGDKKYFETTIAIQPFGNFDTALVSFAKIEIEKFYTCKVSKLSSQPLPKMAWYSPRNRWRADSLLNWLIEHQPKDVNYILGFTNQDISTTKDDIPDWGVFGLGYMPGPSCVVSTFRLKKAGTSDSLFRERFSKVFLHELGHNFGLPHCPTKTCMMEDAAGTIRTVDTEKKQLCEGCKKKLGIQ